jgi:hypothetical protein
MRFSGWTHIKAAANQVSFLYSTSAKTPVNVYLLQNQQLEGKTDTESDPAFLSHKRL